LVSRYSVVAHSNASFFRFYIQLWIHWLLSFDGLVEVCHIETPAGKKQRLAKEQRNGNRRGKAKGRPSQNNADAESVADLDLDELEGEENDGTQECLPGKKRKSHTYGDEYRPLKKGRTEWGIYKQ
jgi:hypothetical protein